MVSLPVASYFLAVVTFISIAFLQANATIEGGKVPRGALMWGKAARTDDPLEAAWICSEWVDAVGTGLEAGLGLLQAFTMATVLIPSGKIRADFERVEAHLLNGLGFSNALERAASEAKGDVPARVLSSLRRSQVHGSQVVEVLAQLRDAMLADMRAAREEQVARLPVKMLFPLAVFVLPAILILVCAPFVAEFTGSLR